MKAHGGRRARAARGVRWRCRRPGCVALLSQPRCGQDGSRPRPPLRAARAAHASRLASRKSWGFARKLLELASARRGWRDSAGKVEGCGSERRQ
eukprot:363789-Chlamydomonas_euryale.AAC.15